jgi:hypothetical protein
VWLVLTGAQAEGTGILEAVSVEGVLPEAEMTTGGAFKPTETAAPGVTERVHDEALPLGVLDQQPTKGST